ncbi:MAG: carbohydrate binding family 9 domain-containing protein [Cyclobacteriaceae bacterium]|nr:carbohydrate binding family 9 domain-containing protein [Cyclobacteriaceae bacterium]
MTISSFIKCYGLGLVCVLSCPRFVGAQDAFNPPAIAPSFFAVETTELIQLDGRLIEPAWQQAEAVKDFFRMEPRQGGKYLYETDVRVLFDKKNLYFGVFCKDSVGRKGIRVQDYRRDFIYGDNDVFYLQLDPQNLKRYCVSFQTTPLGTQRDLQAFDDTNRDSDWDALWRVRTHVTDSGYYAEFAIPFKSLRYDKPASDAASWGVTFARMARRDYEVTVYPQVPQAYSPYRMTYAARMNGLVLPPPSANIRIQPYGLVQYNRNTNAAEQVTENTAWKAGGEIKWAITPHSVLDVTFNTDFAQADVDRAVNNLTRFNVFFPERRQFFLENSGVYAGADIGGVKPFFSRAIGLSNAQFNAGPVPIDAGLRFTDRTQKRTWAGMYVRQRETDFQGAANFGVMRYLKNYGKQNNIGAMVTHRLDETNGKGFSQHNNITVTLDGFIRPDDTWTIQYLASVSRDNANDSVGFAGSFYAGRALPKWYYGWVTKAVSGQYVPGMGFVFAQNTIHHNPGGYYIWRPKKWKFIRRFDPGFFVNYYHNVHDLSFQQADLYLFPVYTIFQDGSFFEYAITPTWQNINFDFSLLGIPVEQRAYYYTRHRFTYNTDQSKKYSLRGSFELGDYYNGKLNRTVLGVRIAPAPQVALTADYEYNDFRRIGANQEDKTTSLVMGGLRLAWDANIQLSLFYQYNSFNEQGRWNVRGSWQFAPLSFLYLVFNETNFINSQERNQSGICKLSYLKQF